MNKLIHAGFHRLRLSKTFWFGMAALVLYSMAVLLMAYYNGLKYGYPLSGMFAEALFQQVMLIGAVLAIFCSLFVGTEYSDGTIRNKLMVGHSRDSIYMSNFIICMAAGLAQVIAAFAIVLSVGALLMGMPNLAPLEIAKGLAILLFMSVSFTALFNMASMLINSKAHAAILVILLAFGMILFGLYLSQMLAQPEMIQEWAIVDGEMQLGEYIKNPHYISGMKREVYKFLSDCFPGTQSVQLVEFSSLLETLGKAGRLCFFSAVVAVVSNLVGVLAFRKKDIK